MACIRVKDRNNLGLGVPVRDVVLNELEVVMEAGRSPSNAKAPTLNTTFTSASFTGISI